jgi:hypothetical protein
VFAFFGSPHQFEHGAFAFPRIQLPFAAIHSIRLCNKFGGKKKKNDVLLKLVGKVIGYKSRELVTALLSMERRNDAVHSSAHTDYGNIQRSSTATIHQATPVQKIVVLLCPAGKNW